MFHQTLRTVLVAAFTLLAAAAYADGVGLPSTEFSLPSPPRPGTQAFRKDFDVLHWWQRNRDEKACALARSQESHTVEALFGPSVGPLTANEFRWARTRLEKAFEVTARVSRYFKDKFRRVRPYDTDPSLTPCVKKPGGQRSYPSTHAALGGVGACVLARLYPAKAKRIQDYGAYIGKLRVIAGVHHPSDVAAGQSLARQICERLP